MDRQLAAMRAMLHEQEITIRDYGWRILDLKLKLARAGIDLPKERDHEMTCSRVRALENAVDMAREALQSGAPEDHAKAMELIDTARRTT